MKKTIFIFIFLVALGSISYGHAKQSEETIVLFPVVQNGKYGYKYGYIDRMGKIVIKPQFDYASNFSEGLAKIKIGVKWGYIDKEGKIVIKPQFDKASNFTGGLAGVGFGHFVVKGGYIDKTGKYVWNPTN